MISLASRVLFTLHLHRTAQQSRERKQTGPCGDALRNPPGREGKRGKGGEGRGREAPGKGYVVGHTGVQFNYSSRNTDVYGARHSDKEETRLDV